ncbi:hypothetical protein [Miniphocaeibacter halophilus]|uniref:Uncharacterized protein n=1 Tax=Miniphocaeibacter halophilus TaxID=2931922 RepID=A0AC61MQY9_9FIRM|nr:hypothetical protein [Miniphocaeibacter halophilus]QQK07723.1 hypothetical protein JFY71_10610 [Miniphocaeibacter halophilus]
MSQVVETNKLIFGMDIGDNEFSFTSSIETALISAESEIQSLKETITSVESLRPNCDKLDYALAASSGVLCGIIDIFLVGKPNKSQKTDKMNSPAADVVDRWFEKRIFDFAKLCGWDSKKDDSLSTAITFLEEKFEIPYDQRGAGDSGSDIFGLTPSNHHFKSLGHNPTLLGLFFSILDQFTNQSHFVSGGDVISLQNADGKSKLNGKSVPAKLFSGFVNWFGHLISDVSGSSSSKGRGMGIPSPFWSWTNDLIVIKRYLNIPPSQFDSIINELALSIYTEGFDIRFQATQAIPVFINEIITRFMYAIRRLIKYLATTDKTEISASDMWKACEPFSNATVKRMLTVGHGVFCMIDLSDATIRAFSKSSGAFNMKEFALRLNIAGVGRFTISLYGEVKRAVSIGKAVSEAQFARREIAIVENYLSGLSILSKIYDDENLVDFVDDFKNSDMYVQAFQKSVKLAELRKVSDNKILRTKSDIDSYFREGDRQ